MYGITYIFTPEAWRQVAKPQQKETGESSLMTVNAYRAQPSSIDFLLEWIHNED